MMATFKAEDLEFDRYLNFDANYTPLSNINKGKTIAPPIYQQPEVQEINTYAPLQTQTFAGPSHQYDLHKQHIPLPPGALASLNAAPLQYGYQNYMGSNGVFDDFGFSHRGSVDMDMDADNFYNDCIDPNMVGEEDSPIPTRVEIVRAYPGMHSAQAQQAALAKQQQQVEIQKQQQMKRPSHKPSGSKGKVDPITEERISQLLQQMRQTANVPTPSQENSPPAMSKSKKEEEEMDEDERLLASEEGKKLSSKERRQLRNKVSARAFRSRRKEYIGQLESEVADKTTEADQLRAENEALKAENTRLTDLTKLLLSSSSFAGFLNELSSNGLPASIIAPTSMSTTTTPEFQAPIETIVEEEVDFNSLEGDSSWNTGMDFNFGSQVYTVDIPETFVDAAVLSGKTVEVSAAKEIMPTIESSLVEKVEYIPDESVEFDETDPAFDLFTDSSAPLSTPYHFFGSISFEKASETFDLIPRTADEPEDITLARLAQLCSSFDSIASRWEDIPE